MTPRERRTLLGLLAFSSLYANVVIVPVLAPGEFGTELALAAAMLGAIFVLDRTIRQRA